MLRQLERGDILRCIDPVYDLISGGLYVAIEDEFRRTVCVRAHSGESVCHDHGYEVWRFEIADVSGKVDAADWREATLALRDALAPFGIRIDD